MPKRKNLSFLRHLSPIWIVGIAGFFVFTGIILYRSFYQAAGINEVSTSSSESLVPPNSCIKNKLNSLYTMGACDTHSFRWAFYRCKNSDEAKRLGKGSECLTPSEWQKMAEAQCPEVCLPPSPTPARSPKPTPSCRPRPACLDSNPRCLLPETEDMCPAKIPSPVPAASGGCYYRQVQCFRAPCPSVLVCPTPVTTSIPAASSCIVPPPQCIGNDGNKPIICAARPGTTWCE